MTKAGWIVLVIFIVVVGVGFFGGGMVRDELTIDRCLDNAGSWDFAVKKCAT